MNKYAATLMFLHFCWVCISYTFASLQEEEDDKKFMMGWVTYNGIVFIVWLPLYLKGLSL